MRLFSLLLVLCTILPLHAAELEATVSLSRDSGLLIGDTITATVELPINAAELDVHTLPQDGKRQGAWLFLNKVTQQERQLILHYQLVNVPPENRLVQTPKFQLRNHEGEFISVPSVRMQIGSFLLADAESNSDLTPQADMPVPLQSTHSLMLCIWIAFAVLILSSLIWLVWHFGLRPRPRLPFATALFELNKMRLLGRRDADEASRHLHHAFNRSAGRVIIHSQMEKLWQACPWLLAEKPDIEQFYAKSAAHFFSKQYGAQGADFSDVHKLAKACRVLERVA